MNELMNCLKTIIIFLRKEEKKMKELLLIIGFCILAVMSPIIADWIVANHFILGLIVGIAVNVVLWGKEFTND